MTWPTRLVLALLVAAGLGGACGKKGPPLAPLLKVPVAAQDVASRRVGAVADVQLRIPATNTDNTRPADIVRVEVYGFTGPAPATGDVVKDGTLVASIPVRKPPDEEEASRPRNDDRAKGEKKAGADNEPRPARPPASMQNGFDQGDLVLVTETLGPAQLKAVQPKPAKKQPIVPAVDPWQPALQPEAGRGDSRLYFLVGVNHKGQRGPFSPPLPVPLTAPPSAPGTPTASYDEKSITLSWSGPPDLPGPIQAPPAEGMLPSTPRGMRATVGGYNVYETGPAPGPASSGVQKTVVPGSLPKPLNAAPLQAAAFTEPSIAFGKERCFVVRAVAQSGAEVVESEPSPPACVTPSDRFPPAAPKGLSAVASEGAISLIWEASAEADLAGYIVLRAEAGRAPEPLVPTPIKETTFRDTTAVRGARYVYTVIAVDNAGNRSAPSDGAEETAR